MITAYYASIVHIAGGVLLCTMRRGTAEKATMGGSADTPMKAGSEGKATQTVSDKDKKANRISRFLGSKAGKSTESLAVSRLRRLVMA